MSQLPDQVSRTLIERRLAGYSTEEIATELGISVHAVRRKLRLVRGLWAQEAG